MTHVHDVAVVGAGVAGITAARTLQAAGADVVVVDKSAGPGGRVATRRIGDARADHGAQFFTVRSDEFAALVDELSDAGCPIRVWGHGLATAEHVAAGPGSAETAGDGHPRYVVAGGMNQLLQHAARSVDVRADVTVDRVVPHPDGWRVVDEAGEDRAAITARAVLLTPPVPQSLPLVRWVDVDTRILLTSAVYDPCVAVLVVLDAPSGVPEPGGVQIADGPIRFIGDNQAKGASPTPVVTIHLDAHASRRVWDTADDEVVAQAVELARAWLGPGAVLEGQVKRWRYAQPTDGPASRVVTTELDGRQAVFAGDAFGEAKIEGAARSGLAAAAALS